MKQWLPGIVVNTCIQWNEKRMQALRGLFSFFFFCDVGAQKFCNILHVLVVSGLVHRSSVYLSSFMCLQLVEVALRLQIE